MLEYAKTLKNLEIFLYFSTDEVFGHAPNGVAYKEWDRHKPGNPYSASKSASEMICLSYENTYKVPLMMVNSMNVIGLRQESEKFLGLVMKKVLAGEKVHIHADDNCKEPGSRNYIHAKDIVRAIAYVIDNGEIGEKYNISGETEVDNLNMAKSIANEMGMELNYELVNFHATRPAHDLHYRLDGEKLNNMGWKVSIPFYDALKEIVSWTLKHEEWLEDIY
jgi:dTDP-glucose 4,6-dehydratase